MTTVHAFNYPTYPRLVGRSPVPVIRYCVIRSSDTRLLTRHDCATAQEALDHAHAIAEDAPVTVTFTKRSLQQPSIQK